MYKRNIMLAALSFTLAATIPASASELSYSNISVGYQAQTSDNLGLDVDLDGIKFDGSFAVTDSVFLRADYLALCSDTVDFDPVSDEIDLSKFSIGVGFHFPVAETTDLVTTISYANVEEDFLSDSSNEDGFIASGGIRSKPTDMIELGANVNYADIGNESNVGFDLTGRVFVLPVASIGLSYNKLEDSDGFLIDARYDF